MLTYILSHRWHCLAVSDVRAVWVCLCLDRLELEANSLPQSEHFFLADLGFVILCDEEYSDKYESKELTDIAGEADRDKMLKSSASCAGRP